MRPLWLLLTFLVTVSGVVAAPRDKLPSYDIQRNCSAEASDTGTVKDAKAQCVRLEEDAKKQLDQRWSKLQPSDNTSKCIQMSGVGDVQSYVELLTCLEMSDYAGDHTTVAQATSTHVRLPRIPRPPRVGKSLFGGQHH